MRVLRFTLILMVCLALGAGATSAEGAAKSTAASAAAFAEHVLREARLPAGSRPCPPGARLGPAAPAVRLGDSALTDRHDCWITPLGPPAVAPYLRAHLPTGASVSGSGSGSRPAGTQFFLQLSLPVHGPNQYAASLVETWSARHSRGSVLRVDAEVVWLPARPQRSLLSGVRSARLTGYAELSLDNLPKGPKRIVLSGAKLAAIIRVFNSLAEGPRAGCMEDTSLYRLQLSTAKGPVSIEADECESSVILHRNATASLTLSDRHCLLARTVATVLPAGATASRRWASQCRPS